MQPTLNKVILLGKIGDRMEFRHLPNGGALCRFSVSTQDTFIQKSTGELKTVLDWHSVCTWGEQAKEIQKKIKQGLTIYLEARLKSRQWETKDGVSHKSYELFLETYTIYDMQESAQTESVYPIENTNNSISPLTGFELNDLDEIPF